MIAAMIRDAPAYINSFLGKAFLCRSKGFAMFTERPNEEGAAIKHAKGITKTMEELHEANWVLFFVGFCCISFSLAVISKLNSGNSLHLLFLIPTTTMKLVSGAASMVSTCVSALCPPIGKTAQCATKIGLGLVLFNRISTILYLTWFVMNWKENGVVQRVGSSQGFTQLIIIATGIIVNVVASLILVGCITIAMRRKLVIIAGQAVNQHRGYFMVQYCLFVRLLTIAAASKVVLGFWLTGIHGFGVLSEPIRAGYLIINSPIIFTIGAICELSLGVWGMRRYINWVRRDQPVPTYEKHFFVKLTCFSKINLIVLGFSIFHLIVQGLCGQGLEEATDGATNVTVCIVTFFAIPWLDYKLCTTASRVDRSDYSLPEDTECDDDFLVKWVFGLTEGKAPGHSEVRVCPERKSGCWSPCRAICLGTDDSEDVDTSDDDSFTSDNDSDSSHEFADEPEWDSALTWCSEPEFAVETASSWSRGRAQTV